MLIGAGAALAMTTGCGAEQLTDSEYDKLTQARVAQIGAMIFEAAEAQTGEPLCVASKPGKPADCEYTQWDSISQPVGKDSVDVEISKGEMTLFFSTSELGSGYDIDRVAFTAMLPNDSMFNTLKKGTVINGTVVRDILAQDGVNILEVRATEDVYIGNSLKDRKQNPLGLKAHGYNMVKGDRQCDFVSATSLDSSQPCSAEEAHEIAEETLALAKDVLRS